MFFQESLLQLLRLQTLHLETAEQQHIPAQCDLRRMQSLMHMCLARVAFQGLLLPQCCKLELVMSSVDGYGVPAWKPSPFLATLKRGVFEYEDLVRAAHLAERSFVFSCCISTALTEEELRQYICHRLSSR